MIYLNNFIIVFDNKRVFITGGTGTWGESIIKYLIKNYNLLEIIVFSRNESLQVKLERKINSDKLTFVLGDIRNKNLLNKFIKGCDFVIHLAAMKHVYKCNENPGEVISINIEGTQNIIDSCILNKVDKCLYISTDKAVEPYNLYGNTKAIGEKLIISANDSRFNNGSCIFSVLRAGNIIASSGSIFEIFLNQIKNNKSITYTDLNINRFFSSIGEIVSLIGQIYNESRGGEVFILKSKVLSLKNVLDICLEVYNKRDYSLEKIDLKYGEKLNEILISKNEVIDTFDYNENCFVITKNKYYLENYKKVFFEEYSTITADKYIDFSGIKNELIKITLKDG